MNVVKIVIALIILAIVSVAIYFIVKKVKDSKKTKLVGSLHNGKVPFVVKSKDIPKSEYGNEYTVNFWFYMNDWEYRDNKPKCILFRGDKDATSTSPGIWFFPKHSNLKISFQLQSEKPADNENLPSSSCPNSMNPINNPDMLKKHRGSCNVKHVPLQRWNNVSISLWNQTIDVYLNGRLVRSCVMPEYPVPSSGDIYVSHYGGFNGYISNLQYFASTLNSNQIQSIYKKGPNLTFASDKNKSEEDKKE